MQKRPFVWAGSLATTKGRLQATCEDYPLFHYPFYITVFVLCQVLGLAQGLSPWEYCAILIGVPFVLPETQYTNLLLVPMVTGDCVYIRHQPRLITAYVVPGPPGPPALLSGHRASEGLPLTW